MWQPHIIQTRPLVKSNSCEHATGLTADPVPIKLVTVAPKTVTERRTRGVLPVGLSLNWLAEQVII